MKGFLYTDGGARGNPGPAATGVILKDSKENTVVKKGTYVGIGTNNEAEYKALVEGLSCALNKGFSNLECFLDSELVIKQLHGIYKVKNERMKIYHTKVRELEKRFKSITYTHVKRALNKEADSIVNKVLDDNGK